jgi:hypothetical protein
MLTAFFKYLDEMLNAAVVSPFRFIREITGGKLIHRAVIMKTFTAYSFPGTWLVAAVAPALVFLYLALHS